MNIIVALATVVIVLPTSISSLQCYFSETRITRDYCFARNNTANNSVSCDPKRYRCGIAQYTNRGGVRHFLRGCLDKAYCGKKTGKHCKNQPRAAGRTHCHFHCCAGVDYSNKGLTCSSCLSFKSDADCFKNMTNEDCPLDQQYRCGRTSYRFMGDKVFYRGCIALRHCNPVVDCKEDINKSDCATECCQGDLCNSKPSSTYGKKCNI